MLKKIRELSALFLALHCSRALLEASSKNEVDWFGWADRSHGTSWQQPCPSCVGPIQIRQAWAAAPQDSTKKGKFALTKGWNRNERLAKVYHKV